MRLHIYFNMIPQVILFSFIILILAEAKDETTDNCESKAEISVSLDLAIHLLSQIKNYHKQDRNNNIHSKINCNQPIDCEDVLRNGGNKSGIYKVWPRSRVAISPIEVFCDMETNGGGWTVFQRRGDFGRPKDYFFKDWDSYKHGFGDIDKDFWLGNDNIFALSNQRDYSLRIDLKDVEGKKVHAIYSTFWIDDEDRQYTLHISGYSGDAGDSMISGHSQYSHDGQKFSTKDRKNDNDVGAVSCASKYKGGWWYNRCHAANLNGLYHKGKHDSDADGVNWKEFKGYSESLEWTEMKMRSRNFSV